MNTSEYAFDICRCAVAEAEKFHGTREDQRETKYEQLLADAPDFEVEVEANLVASGSFQSELFTVCPLAVNRLAIWSAGYKDLLPDYVHVQPKYFYDTQLMRDAAEIKKEVRSWLETETMRLTEEWIKGEL